MKRLTAKLAGMGLRGLTRIVDYPVYPWVVWWELTRRCNLNCIYCSNPAARRAPCRENHQRALRRILRLRPKYIEILGGEPLMVPELPRILAALRADAGRPCVMLSTNLSLGASKALPLIGNVDHLFVSVDALGALNKDLRGIDGDTLMESFREIAEANRKAGSPTVLHTATVVTIRNDDHVGELLDVIHGIEPEAEMVLIPVEPYDHPLSLSHHPDRAAAFQRKVDALKARFPIVMTERFGAGGQASGEAGGRAEPFRVPAHRCCRQFFRVVVNAEGKVITCKPGRLLEYYSGAWRRAENAQARRVLLRTAFKDLFLSRNAPVCRLPCSAAEFLDEFIGAAPGAALPREICMFRGRFTDHELAESAAFIRTRLNPAWDPKLEDQLAQTPQTTTESRGGPTA